MDPSNIQQYASVIAQTLEPLAAKIGQGGMWMFTQAMKNNYATAWTEAASFASCVVAWVPAGLFLRWGFKKPNDDAVYNRFYYSEGAAVGATVSTIVLGVLTVSSLIVALFDAIPRFVAPEWHTIQDIAQMFHK